MLQEMWKPVTIIERKKYNPISLYAKLIQIAYVED